MGKISYNPTAMLLVSALTVYIQTLPTPCVTFTCIGINSNKNQLNRKRGHIGFQTLSAKP